MDQFLAKLAEEIKEAQRQEQSRIIVPERQPCGPEDHLEVGEAYSGYGTGSPAI
jgi:hypothetical protein